MKEALVQQEMMRTSSTQRLAPNFPDRIALADGFDGALGQLRRQLQAPQRDARAPKNAGKRNSGASASETGNPVNAGATPRGAPSCSAGASLGPLRAQHDDPSQPNALPNDGGQRHNAGE